MLPLKLQYEINRGREYYSSPESTISYMWENSFNHIFDNFFKENPEVNLAKLLIFRDICGLEYYSIMETISLEPINYPTT